MTAAIIQAFDARADERRRTVEVTHERIVIARRYGGIDMRVALEPRQYRGVLLSVLIAEGTDFLFQVRLLHADSDMSVTLGECGEETAARALWRRWAQALELPRLVERAEGEIEIDRSPRDARSTQRRRGRATHRRRTRFLARRQVGRTLLSAPAE